MMDWTYDIFAQDMKLFGIESKDDSSNYNAYFIARMKSAAAAFLEKWKQQHDGKLYDHGWVGDAFAATLMDGWFSDFYKDTYNQRPHLPIWYYVHLLGLPMQEDTSRLFCDDPVERAIENARGVRNWNAVC